MMPNLNWLGDPVLRVRIKVELKSKPFKLVRGGKVACLSLALALKPNNLRVNCRNVVWSLTKDYERYEFGKWPYLT